MLELHKVSVVYDEEESAALEEITFEADKGEFICVLGRSGAGKSTLVRTINGLRLPDSGTVSALGKNVSTLAGPDLRSLRAEVGMIFQHFQLIPRMSVRQNVYTGMFGRQPQWKNLMGVFADKDQQQAEEVVREVGLSGYEDRRVEQLSGGQKQRVGIARAMVQNPSILLGDEPVASLDPATSDHIFQILHQLHHERGLLTMINVHDVKLAQKYATRILGLKMENWSSMTQRTTSENRIWL